MIVAQLGWGASHPRVALGKREALVPRIGRLAVLREPRGLSLPLFFGGVALIVLVSAVGLLYIRQVVSTTTSGYDVSALERRAEHLQVEEAKLQLDAATLESLKRVEEKLPKLNLVPVNELTYTSPVSNSVVTGQLPVGTARQ